MIYDHKAVRSDYYSGRAGRRHAPNSEEGYNALAYALSVSGKPAEAPVAAHKAMRLDPQRRDSYAFSEGRAYMLMGRYEEAIPLLQRFLVRSSHLIPAHVMLTSKRK
jgi:tetratricopeptide (TPR) repeat protein